MLAYSVHCASGSQLRPRRGEVEDGWEADGAMMRQAYTFRPDDDDFGQAGTLVREVWTDEIREAFVNTVAGHLLAGVEGDVLERAFQYWHHVDADTGKRIEELVRSKSEGDAPGGQPEAARADASDPVRYAVYAAIYAIWAAAVVHSFREYRKDRVQESADALAAEAGRVVAGHVVETDAESDTVSPLADDAVRGGRPQDPRD